MDDLDRRILHHLQQDARNNTNTEISERVGVAPSTVGNRIRALEADGVIRGYKPVIDYERAGFPLRVLFMCSAPIPDRRALVEAAYDIPGVVNVKELMEGDQNIHVEVVGESNDDVTRVATDIDALEITIRREVLVKDESLRPASIFED
ncbi:MAG: Lrp/AsnC family transcriptional regulator [Haloplanus sp.]